MHAQTLSTQLEGSRRRFLTGLGGTLGSIALSELIGTAAEKAPGLAGYPHFAPKAKRVICLCSEPSTFMRQICIKPLRTELNQILAVR